MESRRKNYQCAVCLPTRGIINSRTIESVLENLKGIDYKIYFTHDLPLPDSRNHLAEVKAPYIWWVDDDMIIPKNWLKKALALDEDIVAADYRTQTGQPVHHFRNGELVWTGMGCMLVKQKVMKALEKPYFRIDQSLITQGPYQKVIKVKPTTWGGEDVYFCYSATLKGFKITPFGEAKHLRLKTWGEKYLNNGTHEIYEL